MSVFTIVSVMTKVISSPSSHVESIPTNLQRKFDVASEFRLKDKIIEAKDSSIAVTVVIKQHVVRSATC